MFAKSKSLYKEVFEVLSEIERQKIFDWTS